MHSDVKITGAEELQEYMNSLELYGDGGTDFRPAFAYVEELMENVSLKILRAWCILQTDTGFSGKDAAIPDSICIYGAGA